MDESYLKLIESRINRAIAFIEKLKNREKNLKDEKEKLQVKITALENELKKKDERIEELLEIQKFLKDKIELVLSRLESIDIPLAENYIGELKVSGVTEEKFEESEPLSESGSELHSELPSGLSEKIEEKIEEKVADVKPPNVELNEDLEVLTPGGPIIIEEEIVDLSKGTTTEDSLLEDSSSTGSSDENEPLNKKEEEIEISPISKQTVLKEEVAVPESETEKANSETGIRDGEIDENDAEINKKEDVDTQEDEDHPSEKEKIVEEKPISINEAEFSESKEVEDENYSLFKQSSPDSSSVKKENTEAEKISERANDNQRNIKMKSEWIWSNPFIDS